MSIRFELRGKKYTLEMSSVEEIMQFVSPKAIDKYLVYIDGIPYPPKQVIEVALKLPMASFTTMDATRILSNLGFEVIGKDSEQPKTESEILFESYLAVNGYLDFEFEPKHFGKSAAPDYRVRFGNDIVLFEVKEFRATRSDFREGFGCYDPYGPIREKIDAARKKFREFKDECCCLVLYNREKPLVHLGWEFIYGAMLGNLAIQMPFDEGKQEFSAERARSIFSSGGKMRVADQQGIQRMEPQNSRISAVTVLQRFPIGMRRFEVAVKGKEKELGRKLSLEEHWIMLDQARGTERDWSLTQLRVVVNENPYTAFSNRIPLPEQIFKGPYDERYGYANGRIERKFVGQEISILEKSQELAGGPA